MQVETEPYQITLQFITYQFLMAIPAITARFDTLKKQRFLMHLIWQHKVISDRHSFYQTLASDSGGRIQATCPIQSLVNHSCVPNVYNDLVGNKQVLITLRPVKKGQQLFVTYKEDLMRQSTEQRQEYLEQIFGFKCKCSRCEPKIRPADRLAMALDPIYQFIEQNQLHQRQRTVHRDDSHIVLKQKCMDFMTKYGHSPSSDELVAVMRTFMACLQRDHPEYRGFIFTNN